MKKLKIPAFNEAECIANRENRGAEVFLIGNADEALFVKYKNLLDSLGYAERECYPQSSHLFSAYSGEGESIGLFTKGGHYICLIATDGEQFCILDPSYTPEKFTIPERAGRINTDHAPYLYCHKDVVHSETRRNRPFKYHLFARKGGFSAI